MDLLENKNKNIGLIGIGNVLIGDDAAGPYLVKLIESRFQFPANVTLMEAGTPGSALSGILANFDAAIVLDTVRTDTLPGQILRFELSDFLAMDPPTAATMHDPGLLEAVFQGDFTGENRYELILIGVVPETVDLGLGLSSCVRNAMEPMIGMVMKELERFGIFPIPKDNPDKPDIWWENQS